MVDVNKARCMMSASGRPRLERFGVRSSVSSKCISGLFGFTSIRSVMIFARECREGALTRISSLQLKMDPDEPAVQEIKAALAQEMSVENLSGKLVLKGASQIEETCKVYALLLD